MRAIIIIKMNIEYFGSLLKSPLDVQGDSLRIVLINLCVRIINGLEYFPRRPNSN